MSATAQKIHPSHTCSCLLPQRCFARDQLRQQRLRGLLQTLASTLVRIARHRSTSMTCSSHKVSCLLEELPSVCYSTGQPLHPARVDLGLNIWVPLSGGALDCRITWPAVQPAAPERYFCWRAVFFVFNSEYTGNEALCGGVAAPYTRLKLVASVVPPLRSCLRIPTGNFLLLQCFPFITH